MVQEIPQVDNVFQVYLQGVINDVPLDQIEGVINQAHYNFNAELVHFINLFGAEFNRVIDLRRLLDNLVVHLAARNFFLANPGFNDFVPIPIGEALEDFIIYFSRGFLRVF
jgi:hypothetical protein